MSRYPDYGSVSIGISETSPLRELFSGADADAYRGAERVDWTDPRLARIVRLRLLSDPGFPVWDVSYCWGDLKDGTKVRVDLPFDQLPKRGLKRFIIEWAKRERVYAVGLGIFDALSQLQ